MARCLRCGADSSWIEGTPAKMPESEFDAIVSGKKAAEEILMALLGLDDVKAALACPECDGYGCDEGVDPCCGHDIPAEKCGAGQGTGQNALGRKVSAYLG